MGYIQEELAAHTKLNKRTYLRILGMIETEFGEICLCSLEDNYISFDVYRTYYENPPKKISDEKITLTLADKFDDPCFNLCYKININE